MPETAETNCDAIRNSVTRALCRARNQPQSEPASETETETADGSLVSTGSDIAEALGDFMRNLGAALNLGGGTPGEGNGGPYVYSDAPGTTGEGREARPGELGNVASAEGATMPALSEDGILRSPVILFGVGIVLALVVKRIS